MTENLKKVNDTINSLWKTLRQISRKKDTGIEYRQWENDSPLRAFTFKATSLEIEKLFRTLGTDVLLEDYIEGISPFFQLDLGSLDETKPDDQKTLLPLLYLYGQQWIWEFKLEIDPTSEIYKLYIVGDNDIKEKYKEYPKDDNELFRSMLEAMRTAHEHVSILLRVKSSKHLIELLEGDSFLADSIEYELISHSVGDSTRNILTDNIFPYDKGSKRFELLFRTVETDDERKKCVARIFNIEAEFLTEGKLKMGYALLSTLEKEAFAKAKDGGEAGAPPHPHYVKSAWDIANGEYKSIKDFVWKAILGNEAPLSINEFNAQISTKSHMFPCPVCFALNDKDGSHAIIGILFCLKDDDETINYNFIMHALNNHETYILNKWRIDSISFSEKIWVDNKQHILNKVNEARERGSLPPIDFENISGFKGFIQVVRGLFKTEGARGLLAAVTKQVIDNPKVKLSTLQLNQQQVSTYSSTLQSLDPTEGICFLCFWLSFALFLHIRYNYKIKATTDHELSIFMHFFIRINDDLKKNLLALFKSTKSYSNIIKQLNEFIFILFGQLCNYEKKMVPTYPCLLRSKTADSCDMMPSQGVRKYSLP